MNPNPHPDLGTLEGEERDDLKLLDDEPTDGEVLVAMEAEELLTSANALFGESDRLEDIHDVFEDLSRVAAEIKEATPTELYLTESTVLAGTAGTDFASDEIIPSLESFAGKNISTEGMKDFVLTIWKTILNIVTSIWEHVYEFLYRIFGTTPLIRRRAMLIKERALNLKVVKPHQHAFAMGSEITSLSAKYKAPESERDILALLETHQMASEAFFSDYSEAVVRVGDKIVSAIGEFKISEAEMSLMRICGATAEIQGNPNGFYREIPSSPVTNDQRFQKETYYKSESLGNNIAIVYRDRNADTTNTDSVLVIASNVRDSYFSMVPYYSKGVVKSYKGNLRTMSPSAIADVADEVIRLCDLMEGFRKNGMMKLKNMHEKIKRANDQLEKLVDESSNLDGTTTACYKASLKFIVASTRWSTHIQSQLISLNHRVARAALTACDRSLKLYR